MEKPPQLNPDRVPTGLLKLIPLAQRWGISDDGYREALVEEARSDELAELRAAIVENDDELDAWLAGDEADGPTYSDEYIAFSAMRMAADYA